ncbi:hypothetical protein ALC53_03521, partial [Atta colombica]
NLKEEKDQTSFNYNCRQYSYGLSTFRRKSIIKQNRYYSYKMTKIQHLLVTYENSPEILPQNLLWTNECKFSNNDVINHCNHHFWSKDNSYWNVSENIIFNRKLQ